MKQIYLNSPTHANVNLYSGNTTPENSGEFGSVSNSLSYRGTKTNLSQLNSKYEDGIEPRASLCLPASKSPFKKYEF